MATVQPSSVPVVEEQSGWWPSDRSAKARLKAFFTRSKSDRPVRRHHSEAVASLLDPRGGSQPRNNGDAVRSSHGQRAPGGPAKVAQHPAAWSQQNGRAPPSSARPPRPRGTWSPPPLFHAYSQAIMHEFLDIPSTLTDVLFRGSAGRRNSIASERPSRSSLENVSPTFVGDAGLRHQRNVSNTSACSLSQKLFVLSAWGYVFQYSADGLNDRLPEKMLELGPDSVAFASDAIPGRPWVLQISHDGTSTPFPSQAAKTGWSKLAFRHNDSKKLAKDLLLVFDNAKTLGLWLTAVRREIESLGGLEYRPDSKGPGEEEPVVQPRNPLRAQKSLPLFSQSSPHLPSREYSTPDEAREPSDRGSPELLPPMPPHWSASRNVSRSTTESSIHTLSSLDRMRDASFSDDHRSISTTHTSLTSYTNSPTHPTEPFSPSVESFEPTIHAGSRSRAATPTQDDAGEMEMFMATPKRSDRVIPPRTSSLDNSADMISHDLFVQKPLPPIVDNSPKLGSRERPISIIAPLPEPGHIRKTSARYRYDSQGALALPQTPTSTTSRPTSITPGSTSTRPPSVRSRSSSYTQESPDGGQRRVVSYSLFPKSSSEQPRLLPSSLPAPHASSPTSATENVCRYHIPRDSMGDEKQGELVTRSRASSQGSRSGSQRGSKALSVDTVAAAASSSLPVDQPQRSPSVTEAHLQSCFGAKDGVSRPRLLAGKRSLSGNAITAITRETLASPAAEAAPFKLGDAPKKNQVKSQRSMPSLVHRSFPPSGPPPTGPLPALPPTPACLPLPSRPTTAKGRSPVSLTLNCMSSSDATKESKAGPPGPAATAPRHRDREPMRSPPPPPLPPKSNSRDGPVPKPKGPRPPPRAASETHHRQPSSISTSSVESVRHVTAWLSSPRVAAFGEKHDPRAKHDSGKAWAKPEQNGAVPAVAPAAGKAKGLLLNVPLPESPMFGDDFEYLVPQETK